MSSREHRTRSKSPRRDRDWNVDLDRSKSYRSSDRRNGDQDRDRSYHSSDRHRHHHSSQFSQSSHSSHSYHSRHSDRRERDRERDARERDRDVRDREVRDRNYHRESSSREKSSYDRSSHRSSHHKQAPAREYRNKSEPQSRQRSNQRQLPASISNLEANISVSQSDEEDRSSLNHDSKDLPDPEEPEDPEEHRRKLDARSQALTLEIIGDLPYAEVKPPENVLFVCKLNPITDDDDLVTFFSQCGKILSCEVIRDKVTGKSLQYAFIEYENKKDCEAAYLKMQGALIDDSRIHVDFSQSVSKLQSIWRRNTNRKRASEAKLSTSR
ncbi:uncharacterized protein V1516DRAFT_675879 [Lipomyces oligophaga]|uniref:uncharacterized protein n=1 Tax=Lipomyces oligophaga TaxID=45792 RepID=UPI0034CD424B